MLKKLPSNKVNITKNVLFFFRDVQLITVLLLIHDSEVRLSKIVSEISIFDSVLFLLKFKFFSNYLTLKRYNFFQS